LDTVLGVSMAPTAVRMVLVEGENGNGATVDQDDFEVPEDDDAATVTAAGQVASAILGTRESAAEGGYQLASTGVTFTDPIEAAALRDALAAHKVENVMLVSAFLAAAALAQAVGTQTNCARTALLYVEPDAATLAVVDSADGSIVDIHREALPDDDEAAVAQLATMVSGAETLATHPDAVFVVGSGVDIPMIKPALEAATTLPLTAPEEPDTALARGAALASANAPLFTSSTAALAYAGQANEKLEAAQANLTAILKTEQAGLASIRGEIARSSMIASITGWKPRWPNMTAFSITSSGSSLASDSTISTASAVPATTRSSALTLISSIIGLSTYWPSI